MESSTALAFHEFGKPSEVLQLEEHTLADPAEGEVKLRILAAAVHPSDFGTILGKYGKLPQLPAIGGREGVAEIVQIGSNVADFKVGDRVVVPGSVGSWQTAAVVSTENLFALPADIPLEIAAMATVNPPTAWRVLRDSGLSEGDWIIQNAANSAVGLHVIEMARHVGIKTINVVRRSELIEPLKQRGADVVVLEDSGYENHIAELTDGAKVQLALNSIGGESAIRLAKSLSEDGLHVTIGAMQFDKIRFPTRELIFNNITFKGFWMDKWLSSQSDARVKIMYGKIFDLMRKGVVKASVDSVYAISDYKEAIDRAGQPRFGKVLFRMDQA